MKKISFSSIKKMAAGAIIMLAIGAQAQTVEVPFAYDGGTTGMPDGMTATGVDTVNSALPLHFTCTGGCIVIHIAEKADGVGITIKGYGGSFDILESVDGSSYTTVTTITPSSTATTYRKNLNSSSRYVKLQYSYGTSNVYVGNIRLYKREFTIGELGWITYYTDEPFIMPQNTEGHVVNKTADGELVVVKKYEYLGIVPAGTPLLIHADETGTYTYSGCNSNKNRPTDNYLHGNLKQGQIEAVSGADRYYKLAKGNLGLGWYFGAEGGGVFSMGANRAYLALESAVHEAPSLDMIVDGTEEETDIDQIETSEKAVKFIRNGQLFIRRGEHVYNATGLRVQ